MVQSCPWYKAIQLCSLGDSYLAMYKVQGPGAVGGVLDLVRGLQQLPKYLVYEISNSGHELSEISMGFHQVAEK